MIIRGVGRVERHAQNSQSVVDCFSFSLSLFLSLFESLTKPVHPTLVVRLSLGGGCRGVARKRTLKNVIARSPGIVGRENDDAGPLYFPHYSNINVNVDTNG